jgi:hypothetical protein
MAELNPFAIAQHQVDEACERLGIDDATQEMLRWPQREIWIRIPVRMDDGSTRIFHGFRVQYNTLPRPGQGRHPLASRRDRRHGARPGRMDDLEDRCGGYPPGRRQGRH